MIWHLSPLCFPFMSLYIDSTWCVRRIDSFTFVFWLFPHPFFSFSGFPSTLGAGLHLTHPAPKLSVSPWRCTCPTFLPLSCRRAAPLTCPSAWGQRGFMICYFVCPENEVSSVSFSPLVFRFRAFWIHLLATERTSYTPLGYTVTWHRIFRLWLNSKPSPFATETSSMVGLK